MLQMRTHKNITIIRRKFYAQSLQFYAQWQSATWNLCMTSHNAPSLSTNSDTGTDIMVTRKNRKENGISCSKAVMNYSRNIAGTDLQDREYYGPWQA